MLHESRQIVRDLFVAPRVEEIVFGPSMTALNFNLSRAIAKTLPADSEIVVTRMDHDANVSPWLRIAEDHNWTIRWVDFHLESGTLDMQSLDNAVNEKTKVVAAVHASNALGTITPVKRIAEIAHSVGAYFVMDAVQSAPHVPIDVQKIGCDFMLCSAYKFFGPHIGIMWGNTIYCNHYLPTKYALQKIKHLSDGKMAHLHLRPSQQQPKPFVILNLCVAIIPL